MHKAITFMFLGLMVSSGIIFADSRGIIIDTVASDMGVDAWEIAFGIYILFWIGGVAVEMILPRSKRVSNKWFDVLTVTLTLVISVFALSSIAVGDIETGVSSMLTEFYNWYFYFAGVLAIYVSHNLFMRR